MKFKNEKNTEDAARILTITDKDGDALTVRLYVDGKPQVVVDINDNGAFEVYSVALSRSKALKLAYAIIDELDPCVF
jgi:hypothetical protein